MQCNDLTHLLGDSQSGVSRELFDQWADNPRNGVIIADFAVAGTMARQVLDSPPEILTRAGLKVTRHKLQSDFHRSEMFDPA